MNNYKESQFGWLIVIINLPVFIFITLIYVLKLGDRPMTAPVYLMVMALLVFTVLLFHGMTTHVTTKHIFIKFGIGLISKRILIDEIESATEVENSWKHGWGIRILPGGMLYNISGFSAVELRLKKGNFIRIGTRNSKRLVTEIDKRLPRAGEQ